MSPQIYLAPGLIYAAPAPCRIRTILGSCVAVTLWSRALGVGGMNHFLLPRGPERDEASARYGDTALPLLAGRLASLGARGDLEAQVFGGASVLGVLGFGLGLGDRNVVAARDWLAERRIPVRRECVLGFVGRRVEFDVETGEAHVVPLGGR